MIVTAAAASKLAVARVLAVSRTKRSAGNIIMKARSSMICCREAPSLHISSVSSGATSITGAPMIWQRFFSDDSHSDFSPRKKSVPSSEEALKLIEKHVKENKIMLYMKGNPSQPMCGFSAKVVQMLKENDADFASVNVLDYPSIREGIKTYSAWPTIPQLYVGGEFIGGCDIVTSMHESGELRELMASLKKEEK